MTEEAGVMELFNLEEEVVKGPLLDTDRTEVAVEGGETQSASDDGKSTSAGQMLLSG